MLLFASAEMRSLLTYALTIFLLPSCELSITTDVTTATRMIASPKGIGAKEGVCPRIAAAPVDFL